MRIRVAILLVVVLAFGCEEELNKTSYCEETVEIHQFKYGEVSEEELIESLKEPNEPEKINLDQLIPTWPDYYILEKDLVIESPMDREYWQQTYPKGTRVYFKK